MKKENKLLVILLKDCMKIVKKIKINHKKKKIMKKKMRKKMMKKNKIRKNNNNYFFGNIFNFDIQLYLYIFKY